MSTDGMLVPDELWNPVVSQYNGFLTGEPLSKEGQIYIGMMRAHGTSNAGLGSLMPAVSPMVVTRNRDGYVVDWLKVVNEDVGRPDGLFGGDFETKFQYVRPDVAQREMSGRPHLINFCAAENVGDEERE